MAKKTITYEEAVEEIESILSKLENDELNVDELGEKVKRVSFLINHCKRKLRSTEQEVEKILKDIDDVGEDLTEG